jgi:transposase
MLPLVVNMPKVRGKPGRPKQKPHTVVADKAYDCKALRELLRWLGIRPHIPRRGTDSTGLGLVRWVIERTLAWFHQFRRLRTRYDRRVDIHEAFMDLGCAMICWNYLT